MLVPLLLIDDEAPLRSLLARILGLEQYLVTEAGTAKEGLRLLEKEDFPIILCDVKLPDGNGVELVSQFKKIRPASEVILLTAYGTIPGSVKAIQHGAFDYLTKGDDNDRILPVVSRAAEKAMLQRRIRQLEEKVGRKYHFDNMLGHSTALLRAVDLAKKVAPTDATVLLTGETGTGKEVFAEAIHQASTRNTKTFVAVNCSALGREILESELFGHKAGAFTGAIRDKKGLFEEAHQGTLFLDEIGEMPLDLQAKLLRVLETGEFMRVGDTKTIRTDVRIIAATNRDLLQESGDGHFRSDLYYRLSVFQIQLPALRDRKGDIPVLAAWFARFFADKMNRPVPELAPDFIEKLIQYDWKGNIRELKNVIERAVILASGTLTADLLPAEILFAADHESAGSGSSFDLSASEKTLIRKALQHTKGNKTEAARLLGVGLTTLYRKIEEYGLNG
ncbi:MAG TPA: sigma-54 dependent transcriptional regulator [Saprospiraceae bacterium]|nr:sigma-54 dependent transcriptional regulator [Saprospiraceae bacterium]HPI06285.1 sigma-54 dependent transcriptional regulator [Saprospiraceae bacterium]